MPQDLAKVAQWKKDSDRFYTKILKKSGHGQREIEQALDEFYSLPTLLQSPLTETQLERALKEQEKKEAEFLLLEAKEQEDKDAFLAKMSSGMQGSAGGAFETNNLVTRVFSSF